jgi:2-keto-myo-inositol isomerase
MKIAFNEGTALKCKGQSLITDLEACEKYGFDYIEIRADCLKTYLKTGTLEALSLWFKNHKLKPWAYNTLEFINARDEEGEKKLDKEIDFLITVNNAIGMKMINTVASFDAGYVSVAKIKEDSVRNLRRLADKIAPYGMSLSIEFCGLPGSSISQFGPAYDVVTSAGRPNIGITLDTFQFHAMDSHWEDLEKALGEKIFVFHLNDFEDLPIGSLQDQLRLWPGDGCLDQDKTFGILKKIGFDGICTVEAFRPSYYQLSHDDNVRTAKEKTVAVISKYYDLTRK